MAFDTILAYVFNGGLYCPNCADEISVIDTSEDADTGVVFSHHEFDYQPTCDSCDDAIYPVTILKESS